MATKKSLEILPFFRGEAFEIEFIKYLMSDDKELKSLKEGFRERKYTAAQLGLPYRVLSHWDEQKLLPGPEREESGQWRRFSYIEVAWLRVVMRLREFGLPLPTIAVIKNLVMQWNEKENTSPLFEFYFYKAIVNDGDHYVAYSPKGGAGLVSARQLEITRELRGEQDILLISLKSMARTMGLDVADSRPFHALTEAEEELLMQSKLPGTVEVRATVNGGRIEDVIDSKTYDDPSLVKDVLDKMEANGEYGEVSTSIQKGKKQSLTVTRKQRFK